MEYSIDFNRIFKRIKKMLWLVLVVTASAAAVGIAYTWNTLPNVYSSKVTLVGRSSDSVLLMRNYADLVKSRNIADQIVSVLPTYHLDPIKVMNMVQATYDKTSDSAMFYISANSDVTAISVAVANAAANSFVKQLSSLTGTANITIIDQASTPVLISNGAINQIITRIEFAVVGFVLTCAILAIVEIFSKKMRQVDDFTLNGTIDILGVIPEYKID